MIGVLFPVLRLTSSSSPLEDRLPPSVVVNKGLVLDENSVKKLTTLQLSASDQDSEPGELIYRINKQPSLGHLEHAASPGSNQSCGSLIYSVWDACDGKYYYYSSLFTRKFALNWKLIRSQDWIGWNNILWETLEISIRIHWGYYSFHYSRACEENKALWALDVKKRASENSSLSFNSVYDN